MKSSSRVKKQTSAQYEGPKILLPVVSSPHFGDKTSLQHTGKGSFAMKRSALIVTVRYRST
jgi:hypothetical protein